MVGGAIETADAPVYLAAPEPGGWRVRRFGHAGTTAVPFASRIPFILGAFADGRKKTEVVITPSVPDPEEAPTLWRRPPILVREVPQPGLAPAARFRAGASTESMASCTSAGETVPAAGNGVSLEGPEPAADGRPMEGVLTGNPRGRNASCVQNRNGCS